MSPSNMKWLASITIALAITMTNMWMLNHLLHHGIYDQLLAQAWSGVAVVFGLGYAAGIWPHQAEAAPTASTDCLSWAKIATWTFICCTFPWISLPGGGSLGLPAAAIFFALIWRGRSLGYSTTFWQTAMLSGLFALALLIALLFNHSPFRLTRLMEDFSGPLDLEGRHYFHGIVLRTLAGVQILGEATNDLPLHFDRVKTFALLRLAHWAGALPAALLAAALLILWQQLYSWLRRITPGPVLSAEMKRLGLALVALHGVANLLNILWNFGITRQPFGPGLPPLTAHAAWWVLSACLFWILLLAYRQQTQSAAKQPAIKSPTWSTAGLLAGIAAVASFGLLLAVNTAKDVYADNHTPASTEVVRRDITDRRGTTIATSIPAFDLWLIPDQFWATSPANPRSDFSTSIGATQDEERRSLLLKSLNDWPQLHAIVASRLSTYGKSDERQKILAWGINPEVAKKITATGLSGLKLSPRATRHYPQGGLFAHVLGFASLSDPMFGQDGLELTENRDLLQVVTKPSGKAGAPMQTTLDPDLQHAAALALNEGISSHGAISGTAVVIEAETGKIRAMVSSPGFDANDATTYRNPYQPERMLNRARGINFAVGSLLTPLLAAHMIETGRMSPSTTITIGNKLTIGQHSIVDFSPTKSLSLAEVVTKSSNIGQARLALALPLTELRDVTRHLGIGVPLHIRGLTGNIDYEAIDWTEWTPQMHAQPGRYIETNLLQAMRAYLPLANGGRLGRPSLLEGAASPPQARVLSASTVDAIRDILTTAAGPTGTAPLAQLPGVMVAGKTGTIVATNGQPVAAFIGMAPAGNPRWLIGVLLEFPKQQTRLAGNTAAPVFAAILSKIIAAGEAVT